MKQKWTLQRVESLLAEHAASGLAKKDFLESRGIKPATFYYWQRRLREGREPAGFVELAPSPLTEVEVHVEGLGWVPLRGSDAASLARVAAALRSEGHA